MKIILRLTNFLIPLLVLTAKLSRSQIITSCKRSGSFALTFDDGPYLYEKGISNFLSSRVGRGTFFVNGYNYACIYDQASVEQLRYSCVLFRFLLPGFRLAEWRLYIGMLNRLNDLSFFQKPSIKDIWSEFIVSDESYDSYTFPSRRLMRYVIWLIQSPLHIQAWSHPDVTRISDQAFNKQLDLMEIALRSMCLFFLLRPHLSVHHWVCTTVRYALHTNRKLSSHYHQLRVLE